MCVAKIYFNLKVEICYFLPKLRLNYQIWIELAMTRYLILLCKFEFTDWLNRYRLKEVYIKQIHVQIFYLNLNLLIINTIYLQIEKMKIQIKKKRITNNKIRKTNRERRTSTNCYLLCFPSPLWLYIWRF